MRIPARIEYSLRALSALAAAAPEPVNARTLAEVQHIPAGYVYNVLADLRRADLVYALRGNHGGYALTRPPADTTVGTVVRLLGDAGTGEQDRRSGEPVTDALTARLQQWWDAANQASLSLLDQLTLADLADGHRIGPAPAP
ncbi:MAG TPA: Rrf2 family transcriptional regulator [Rugosimonospora sp.]|nr:Rrf2 family transcriptional regulator [Rugosimonospora sp.]